MRVYSHRDTYDSSLKFTTWLYRIALNLATSELRQRVTAAGHLRDGRLNGFAQQSGENERSVPSNDPTMRPNRFSHSELVHKALLQLTPALREVIVLREIENMCTKKGSSL